VAVPDPTILLKPLELCQIKLCTITSSLNPGNAPMNDRELKLSIILGFLLFLAGLAELLGISLP
jgi:hypothetical protein